jgi:probable H4MPT-linked C1 transfer pathway protein
MTWLGLDIGGANLKAASSSGWTRSRPFALWRDPDGLAAALQTLITESPAADGVAVTMTGELCDSFRTKEEGVHHILSAVEVIAAGRKISVYLVDGSFVDVATARGSFRQAAASNWRALAEFVSRFVPHGPALVVDIGSTTSDIIPIVDGCIIAIGTDDTNRLASHELVYSGVGRTPICALVSALPWHGGNCYVAAEVFATTADAYLVLGEIPEDPQADWTADGRPLTVACACQRLARQICADSADLTLDDIHEMAAAVYNAQLRQLSVGLAAVVGRMPRSPVQAVVSGAGEFLARASLEEAVCGCRAISLASQLEPEISRCAPAFAVAVLAQEAEQ